MLLLPSEKLYLVKKLQVKCQTQAWFCFSYASLCLLICGLVGRINFLLSKALLEQLMFFEVMGGLMQSLSSMKELYHSLFCSVGDQEVQLVHTDSQWQGNLQGWETRLIFSNCNCDQLF